MDILQPYQDKELTRLWKWISYVELLFKKESLKSLPGCYSLLTQCSLKTPHSINCLAEGDKGKPLPGSICTFYKSASRTKCIELCGWTGGDAFNDFLARCIFISELVNHF